MLALYPQHINRTDKLTVRLNLHCIMLAAVNNWFERGKLMRLFDHTILLTAEIVVHAKKLEIRCGILSEEAMRIQPVPLPSKRISDGQLPLHSGKNASRCRYMDH